MKVYTVITENLLSKKQLIEKALVFKGLTLKQDSHYYSNPIDIYKLEGEFLKALEKNGFKITKRQDGIITLSDENPQVSTPGFAPSNYWNFRNYDKEKDELILKLRIEASINQRKRGVVLYPVVHGTFLSSADSLPQIRVFEVVVQCDPKAHPVVREIVVGNGEIVVSWTDIGLGGIRRLSDLFDEFRDYKKELYSLANSTISPFKPNPYCPDDNKIYLPEYLPEPYQPALFNLWKEQLKEFKTKI